MKSYRASGEIHAPATDVWRVLSDVASWPRWTPTVTSVEVLDGDALALGKRFRVVQPKLQPFVWTVVDFEPEARFTWEATGPGVRMSAAHVVRHLAPSRTQIELAFSFQGAVGRVVAWLYRGVVESYLQTEVSSLKVCVERMSASRHDAA